MDKTKKPRITNLDDLYYNTSPFKATLKLALPVMLAQLFFGMYSFINLMFMNLLLPHQPNSNIISVSLPLYNIIISSIFIFTSGSTSRMSYYLGKNNEIQANKIFNNCSVNSLLTSLLFVGIGLAIAYPIFYQLSAKSNSITSGTWAYFWPSSLGIPCLGIGYIWSIMYRNTGDQKTYVLVNFVMVFFNIISQLIIWIIFKNHNNDPNVIYRLIGLCNFIGDASGAVVIVLIYFWKHKRNENGFLRLRWEFMKWNWKLSKEIISIGFSAFIFSLGITVIGIATNLVFRLVPIQHSQYIGPKTNTINVHYWQLLYGAAFPVWSLLTRPINGIIIAGRVVTIYNYGKGNYQRVKDSYRSCVFITAAYLILVELITIIFGALIIKTFFNIANGQHITFDANNYIFPYANRDAHNTMMIMGAFFWLNAFAFSLSILFQAQNKPLWTIITILNRGVLIELTLVFLFGELSQELNSYWAFWVSYPIMDFIGFIFAWLLYKKAIDGISNNLGVSKKFKPFKWNIFKRQKQSSH